MLVQFQAQKNKPDCASCDKDNLKCSKDAELDYQQAIMEWREKNDSPHAPDMDVLRHLGVCPIPLFSDISIEAVNLYYALSGFENLSNPREYYALPALYVQAVNIILAAIGRIKQ
jgi:hypothetical protein